MFAFVTLCLVIDIEYCKSYSRSMVWSSTGTSVKWGLHPSIAQLQQEGLPQNLRPKSSLRLSFWCGYLSGVAIFPVKTVLMVFVFCTLCVDTSDSPNAMTLVKGTVKWIGGPNLI